MSDKTNTAHYVDNKEFFAAMCEWKDQMIESESAGEPRPQCSRYIGECFVKICNHLAYKANFVNYSYRDEMVLDGIEQCLRYAHNFNPVKSKNAFAYFTQIAYYAFVRRIKKETKQDTTKLKYLSSMDLHELLNDIEGESSSNDFLQWVRDQIDAIEKDKAELDTLNTDSNKPKRRPLYFDAKKEENDEEVIDKPLGI